MKKNESGSFPHRWFIFVLVLPLLIAFPCTANAEGEPAITLSDGAVREAGILRVGMECAYAPYNWTQSDDSNGAVPIAGSNEYANGYDVMMAKRLADALGCELEIYKIKWDGLIMAVNSNKIDAVVAGMSTTENRKLSVDFTDVYYKADIVCLVRADGEYASAASLEDLRGVSATAQLNTIWYDMIDQIPEVDKQPALDTLATMIVAVTSGKVDAVVCDIPSAMAAETANSAVKMLTLPDGPFLTAPEDTDCGIAVKKGNAALLDGLNAALAQISEEERAQIMQAAIDTQPLSQGA